MKSLKITATATLKKMVEMMEDGYAKIYFKIDGFLGRKEESIVMENGEI